MMIKLEAAGKNRLWFLNGNKNLEARVKRE